MPGRQSTIRSSPHLKAIETALIDGIPQRQIAKRYGVSLQAVNRYALGVVKPAVANALKPADQTESKLVSTNNGIVEADSKAGQEALIRQSSAASILERRIKDFDRLLHGAEEGKEYAACASLINSETTRLRLLAELSGELQPQSTQTTAIVLLMPQQPSQAQQPATDAIDAEWTPG